MSEAYKPFMGYEEDIAKNSKEFVTVDPILKKFAEEHRLQLVTMDRDWPIRAFVVKGHRIRIMMAEGITVSVDDFKTTATLETLNETLNRALILAL